MIHDFVDTRLKVLKGDKPVFIRIRPWRHSDTKVTIKEDLQNKSSREYLLESKDYKGTL